MKINLINFVLFFLIITVSFGSSSVFGQTENNGDRVWDVKSHGALGDGIADDTKAIQETVLKAAFGDTVFIPSGTFLVSSIALKTGVHIKSEGLLRQKRNNKQSEGFSLEKQNSSTPLFRGKNVSDIYLSFSAHTFYEAVYLLESKGILIDAGQFMGDSTHLRSFSGILAYNCEDISIRNTTISHFGKPREHTHSYQPGTGIRILSSKNISITGNTIKNNGENGVFIHKTSDVEISNNHIHENGMSAIQVAFGSTGIEKNYRFIQNIMVKNAADGIDINNRSTQEALSINCLIKDNISRENGFVNGQSTPDGSGIATLINVSEVEMINNQAIGCNRPALYVESCGKIDVKGNTGDNEVEIVMGLDNLNLSENSFSSVNFMANVKARKIFLETNKFKSLSIPNGISVDSLILKNNVISNASLNFNLNGNIYLVGNHIQSQAMNGAILVVKVKSAMLRNNIIHNWKANALTIRQTAENVSILDNDIRSVNLCIQDFGSSGLNIRGNIFTSLSGGKYGLTMLSSNPDELYMADNIHYNLPKTIAVLLEGNGTAIVRNEKIFWGYANYGSVVVTELEN